MENDNNDVNEILFCTFFSIYFFAEFDRCGCECELCIFYAVSKTIFSTARIESKNKELKIQGTLCIHNFPMQLCAMCEYLDKKIKCKRLRFEQGPEDWEIRKWNWK